MCTPEQCNCGKCGKQTTVIGYEETEVLDVRPAEYFVRVISVRSGSAVIAKSREFGPRWCRSVFAPSRFCPTN